MEPAVGTHAPDFSLPDQDGKLHRLSDYRGRWVVVYFYPRDDTPGCTVEACEFRDSFKDLADKKIIVLGISKDSVTSHAGFSGKYKLNFPLLSDESKSVIQNYGAWGTKKFMGREFTGTRRMTYLIDPKGIINKVFPHVTPKGHAGEILQAV